MLKMHHRRSGFAQTLAALALLAMAVRALVPAGYMLAPAAVGSLGAITICTGHGAAPLTGFALGQHQRQGGKSQSQEAPCAFAAVAHQAPPESAVIVIGDGATAAPTTPLLLGPGRGLAAPPPWATGPPLTI